MCIGIIQGQKRYSTCLSQISVDDLFVLNDAAIFEIGSLTKIFTYAAMVKVLDKHNIEINSAIGPFLPHDLSDKNQALAKITWQQLATHTSGLSRQPLGWNWATIHSQIEFLTFGDASVDFDTDHVIQYLASAQLNEDKKQANYSNLAVGLLGLLLSDLEQKSYPQLIQDVVAAPLNMSSTLASTAIDADKAVDGYGQHRIIGNMVISVKSQRWSFSDAMAGAGAINSSLGDMMFFLNDRMHAYQQPVFNNKTHTALTSKQNMINLGWIVKILSPDQAQNIILHDGATGGFRSFMAFDESSEVGIVILVNGTRQVTTLGLDIIRQLVQSQN